MATLSLVTLSGYGAAIALLCVLFRKTFGAKRNPLQPTAVPALIPIPFIGHTLGLLVYRNDYYTKICQRWANLPIIALPMFGGNLYLINSPNLIYSMQRQPRTLSFWFFEAQYSARLGGMSKASEESLSRDIAVDNNDEDVVVGTLKATKAAMSPQGSMKDMLRVCIAVMTKSLDALNRKGTQRVALYDYVEHEVTTATTEAVYGPSNPYRDPKVAASFWHFSGVSMMVSLPGVLPKLLAPKGVAGRDKVVRAFFRYFASGLPHDAGQLTKARYTSLKGRVSDEDLARAECVNGLAILSNSAPTAFWTIFHTFSDIEVLEEIRAQLIAITTIEPPTGSHVEKRTIQISRLRELPIFSSLIQETTRYRARGTGPRMAMEDVVLSDDSRQYHIEKGAVVMLAHNAMHLDKVTWGDTADRFDARRFLPGSKIPTNAFRGFGGGVNACPGKSFAVAEIAALVSMLALRFDITPVTGEWTEPGQDLSNMGRESTPPVKKTWVDIVPRSGMEEVAWSFEM